MDAVNKYVLFTRQSGGLSCEEKQEGSLYIIKRYHVCKVFVYLGQACTS